VVFEIGEAIFWFGSEAKMTDWQRCDVVERIPGKVSGAWLVKGTRIPVDAVLANADGYTPEQIAMMFEGLSADDARQVIEFDKQEREREHNPEQERTKRAHSA
jgi:uncharacterized protein (DUF433 family)